MTDKTIYDEFLEPDNLKRLVDDRNHYAKTGEIRVGRVACKHGFTMPAGMDCTQCAIEKKAKAQAERARKRKAEPREIDIQRECVAWFRKTHDDIVIFSIRNEAVYTAKTKHYGDLANRDGRLEGVADLCILAPMHGYHGLFIEMKRPATKGTSRGTQSPAQKRFEQYCTRMSYVYRLCDNVEDFKRICNAYLENV